MNGAVDASSTITAAGRVIVDDTTDASDATDGSLQTDGGLSVAKKAFIGTGATINSGGLAVTAGGITVTAGRVLVDDTTEATDTTDGSLQTDGGLSVAKSAVVGDDLDLLSDAAIVSFGADKDVSLTHVADTGLLLNSSMQLQFGDSGTYIHQSADGVLDLVSDTEIEINATTIDINGAVDFSSTITAAGLASLDAGINVNDKFTVDHNAGAVEALDNVTLAKQGGAGKLIISGSNGHLANPDLVGYLQFPGSDAAGIMKDYKLQVSGGILKVMEV